MRPGDLLKSLDFGEEVAESDERLSRYFVTTSSFYDVVNDRADLILGAKGSGKSAIFRHLADPSVDISHLADVDIVPAFNTQGSVIFRRLAEHSELPESGFRVAWFAYIVGFVANHLVATYSDVVSTKRIERLLEAADLKLGSPTVKGMWGKLDRVLAAIAQRFELEGEISIETPLVPIKTKSSGKLLSGLRSRQKVNSTVDLEEILDASDELLKQLGRRCWLLFDRLDEAFYDNRGLESAALRGLLRAHLDVTSYRTALRSKLFLRSDVLDRITRESGFVNATHLRILKLTWDRESIADLIARRLIDSGDLRSRYQWPEREKLGNNYSRVNVIRSVLPMHAGNSEDVIKWLAERTVDASNNLNPRNIISLLLNARRSQLAVYDRDDPPRLAGKLISRRALVAGWEELSKKRLEDTLLAEFNQLRPSVLALRRRPVRMQTATLEGYLGDRLVSGSFEETVDQLVYAGVLSSISTGVYSIAPLYRPALETLLGRTNHQLELTDLERDELTALVDETAAQLSESKTRVELVDLDSAQRAFCLDYIKANRPDLAPTIQAIDRFSFKILCIGLPVAPASDADSQSNRRRRQRRRRRGGGASSPEIVETNSDGEDDGRGQCR